MNKSQNEPTCKKIQNYIFHFSDLLGQGNFSKVYKAHNEVTSTFLDNTDEIVAIKIIELNSLKSKKLEELLFSEIEVLKKLNHPNILRCYEVFTSNRNCYIITELCNQGDLESKLRKEKCFDEHKAVPIIRDIYLGLEYLAEKNVIHRDLKVANIFVHNNKAKIADFGFAKFTKQHIFYSRLKFRDINIGSPIYMSPEGLIQNVYGPKTDVWSFGIMIYELLHGETPFSHCKTESELKYCMSIPIGYSQIKAQLSSEIKEVIMKCLQVKEEKRPTIAELRKLEFFKKILSQDYDNDRNSSWVPKSIQSFMKSKPIEPEKKTQNTQNNIVGFNWREIDPFNHGGNNRESYKNHLKTESLQNGNEVHYRNETPSNHNMAYKSSKEVMSSISKRQDSTVKVKEARDKILSSEVTFRACVNILHYCRLIYKFVTVMQVVKQHKSLGDENRKNVFVRWLAIVVKTVNTRIDNKEVVYEGENANLREEKLREVSKEYEKKYSKELNLNLSKINPEESTMANYDYMANYLFTVFQQLDQLLNEAANRDNKNLLIMGHYIIMIYEATRSLKKCYDSRDYKLFESYKQIQTLLNMKKEEMDLPSFWWYKKKFITAKK